MSPTALSSWLVLPRPRSARVVITAVFFAFAIGLGLWSGAIPVLLRQTGMDAAGLGVALSLHAAAYIAAMMAGGQLAHVVAPHRLVLASLPAQALGFVALFNAGSPLALTLALVAVGLASGLLDLAMNAEGTAVEHELGRPVLTRMHAAASAAFALGALGGSLLANGPGPRWCLLPVFVVTLPVLLAAWRLGPRRGESEAVLPPAPAAGLGGLVVRLGIVLGLCIGAEMAAQMWSARFLERQAVELAAFAGAGAAFFAGCQACIRLAGDPLRRRLGDLRVIMLSMLLTAAGFLTVAVSPTFALSLLGFALVGLGSACIVPCCFALLARGAPGRSAAAIGAASLIAGLIRLPTPLYLGFVAARFSDAVAFAGIAIGVAAGALLLVGAHRRGEGA